MAVLPNRPPSAPRGEDGHAKLTESGQRAKSRISENGGLQVMPLSRVAEAPVISPRMTAVFGGLFGLATVASIVALLIQVFPVEDQRAVAALAESAATADPDAPPVVAPPESKKRQRKILPSPWRVDKLKGTHLLVSGTMKRQSFITTLKDAGVPKAEVYRILKAMEGVRKFDRTGKNDKFTVAMTRGTKRVEAFEYEIDKTEIYQAKLNDAGLLEGKQLDMKVGTEEFATSFYIGPDFVESYKRAGLEPGLARMIDKAFNGRTSHEAFEEGGVVRLIVVEKTALGAFVKYERIKAIEYRPPDPSKEPKRAYWFESGRSSGYVDGKGRRPSNKGWRTPCPGAPITSHFNPKRMHPVLNRVMPHNGTDYGAPAGTPVYAAFRGKIALVGRHGASGNLVLIDHPGGIQTGYAHLSRFAKGLKMGDKVGTRQLVGYVGSTGRSTGPHLHFSAKKNGKFFNALELKLDAWRLLPVEQRGAFEGQKAALDRALEALPLPDPPPPEPEPEPAPEPDEADDADDGDDGEGSDPEPAPRPRPKPEPDDGPANTSEEDLLGDDLSGDLE